MMEKENFKETLELKPEYLEKLKKIDKEGHGIKFKSIEELRRIIES